MRKKQNQIKQMADEIVSAKGQFYYTVSEIASLLGISRTTATEFCKTIEPAKICNGKKYYILDILNAIYK